jgi:hypothetical protein
MWAQARHHDADDFRRLVSQAVSVDLEIAFDPPPPPLVVNIQGTRSAPLNAWYTWTAQVSGGTEPYQFAWRRDDQLVSSQPTYNGFTGTMGFLLEVDVSDAETQSTSRSIVVSVSGGGGC